MTAANLNKLVGAIERFGQFDVKMQLSTMLTLLLVAQHQDDPDGFSTRDVQRILGISNAAASRNCMYWADGTGSMPGAGHGLVTIGFDPMDRRLRTLRLTPKGVAFINRLEV